MASPSSSLSHPLQLLRFGTSSSGIALRRFHRPAPPSSVRLRQPARGRQEPTAAVSYHGEASGHGNDAIAAAATSVLLRQVNENAVVAELRAARTVGRASQPRKPKEGGGGGGGKIHAAAMSVASARRPKEGHGGQGGSTN
ncbi:unnamed protein product [Urochloa humidicola]